MTGGCGSVGVGRTCPPRPLGQGVHDGTLLLVTPDTSLGDQGFEGVPYHLRCGVAVRVFLEELVPQLLRQTRLAVLAEQVRKQVTEQRLV